VTVEGSWQSRPDRTGGPADQRTVAEWLAVSLRGTPSGARGPKQSHPLSRLHFLPNPLSPAPSLRSGRLRRLLGRGNAFYAVCVHRPKAASFLKDRRHAEGRRPEAVGTPEWIHPQSAATHNVNQPPNTLGTPAEVPTS